MIVPHERGAKTFRIKFSKTDDLEAQPIPVITKTLMPLLEEKEDEPKPEKTEQANIALDDAS